MLLAKLDIKNKLVLIFQEEMNKKNTKKSKKKTSAKKTVFYITNHDIFWDLFQISFFRDVTQC